MVSQQRQYPIELHALCYLCSNTSNVNGVLEVTHILKMTSKPPQQNPNKANKQLFQHVWYNQELDDILSVLS
jgi:hypothetical protein